MANTTKTIKPIKPFKVVQESGTHFVIHDGRATFPVPKEKFGPHEIEYIKSFSGEDGKPEDQVVSGDAMQIPPVELDGTPPGQPGAGNDWINNLFAPEKVVGDFVNPAVPPGKRVVEGVEEDIPPGEKADTTMADSVPATTQPEPQEDALPPLSQSPAAQPPSEEEKAYGLYGAGPLAEYASAMRDAQKVQTNLGKINAEENRQKSVMQGEANDEMAALTKNTQLQFQAKMAQADKLYQDALSSKIDPNQFWHTRTTGQKIAAAIGLFFGGVGSGLTHGPNYAMEMINKAIDHDVEAQKFDISKKITIAGQYRAQGHDILTAGAMAKADLQTLTAGRIMQVAYATGQTRAIQEAQLAADKLRIDAAQGFQSVYGRSLAIQLQRMQLRIGGLQMGALQTLYGQSGTGPAGSQGTFGVKLPPQIIPFLPKDTQEKLVQVAPGEFRPAKDKTIADKAQEQLLEADKVESLASDLFNVSKQHPFATWWPKENQNAQALSKFLSVILFRSEGGINRYNDKEREIANEIVTNPSSFWASVSGGNTGRTQFLKKLLWSNRASTVNNFTIGPKLPMDPPTTKN